MTKHTRVAAARWIGTGIGLAAAAYATNAAVTWTRYGHAEAGVAHDADPLLDEFMPVYDVVERHRMRVFAPAETALAAAKEQDLSGSTLVRAIFKMRELVLGATPDDTARPRALVAQMRSLGWGVLADVPGREIVFGAVTRPWEANVTFSDVGADRFATFDEPGYVKIAWTLRAEPIGGAESVFHTETRAIATDADARARFRRYWAFVSPGVGLIRRLSLRSMKKDAERRAQSGGGMKNEE